MKVLQIVVGCVACIGMVCFYFVNNAATFQAPAYLPTPMSLGLTVASLEPIGTRNARDLCLTQLQEAVAHDIVNPSIPSERTRFHLNQTLHILRTNRNRLQQLRKLLSRSRSRHRRYFLDLGSRAIDSTATFLNKFPQAADFRIHCFEASPRFNSLYPIFAQKNVGRFRSLTYHNNAVGVDNATMLLSEKSVGSSVVRENGEGRSIAVEVNSISFASFLATTVATELLEDDADGYVVVKMDIEKMEFAVIHQLLRTGIFAIIDDLLLECHYNTNRNRAERNHSIHIGLDDCEHLVQSLNDAFSTVSSHRKFEAVLWNSARTSRASRYGQRHGGFFPT